MYPVTTSLEAKGVLRGRNVHGVQLRLLMLLGLLIKDWRWFTPEMGGGVRGAAIRNGSPSL